MPLFLSDLVTRELMGSKYAQLTQPFVYKSDALGCTIEIPVGFICDYESVPILKASSKRAGVIHDYLCRIDSIPRVTKETAADVYGEAQKYRDGLLNAGWFKNLARTLKRKFKTAVVRIAWGYFHKLGVMAPIEDIRGY